MVVGYGSFLSRGSSYIVADLNRRVIRCIYLPGERDASGARKMEQVTVDFTSAQVEEVRSIVETAIAGTFLAVRTKPRVMDGTIRDVAVIEGDRVMFGVDSGFICSPFSASFLLAAAHWNAGVYAAVRSPLRRPSASGQ